MKNATKVVVEIELTPQQIAACLEHLTDDDQAQVFIELAALAAKWDMNPYSQWYQVGRHLVTCECGTEAARDLVRGIAAGIETPLARWEIRKMERLCIAVPNDCSVRVESGGEYG